MILASGFVIIMGVIFVLGYAAIVLEHHLHINKSGTAILTGVILWLVAWKMSHGHEIGEALMHEVQEISGIVFFLMAAMAIVEILVHYRFFDFVEEMLSRRSISQSQLFWFLGGLAFVFSAVLDNLTTTLIMLQIGRKIYKDKHNFLIYTANTVIAANAGGAASPIGDVTTIMLWLANKFTAVEVISIGTLPAIAAWIFPQYLMGKKIVAHEEVEKPHVVPGRERLHWPVIILALTSFTFPVIVNLMGLHPFLGLFAGLGLLYVFIDYLAKNGDEEHEKGRLVNLVQKVDLATLLFFIGILLAVGALSYVGALKEFSIALFGHDPSVFRLAAGNVVLGLVSSILDNVPLVAAVIKMFGDGVPQAVWVLLAITAGTGGSLLVIGSAAGVAAMGQVRELTFGYYLKVATIPALVGYVASIATWSLMYQMVL